MPKTRCRLYALLLALLTAAHIVYYYALHDHLSSSLTAFPYESDPAQNLIRVQNILIKPYIEWHAATRQRLQLATSAHRLRTRILVIRIDRSLTHGLGDRFRGIMHSFMCAVLTHRLFLIQWTDPVRIESVFHLGRRTDALNFTYDASLFPSNGTVLQGGCFKRFESEHYREESMFVDSVPRPNVSLWFNAPAPMRARHAILRKLAEVAPMPAEEQVMSLVMRVLFDPATELRQYIEHKIRNLGLRPESQKYVSIHARLGYGLDEIRKAGKRFDLSKKGLDLSTMARCIADRALRYATRLGIKKPLFYLATDTPPFREELERAIENKVNGATVVSGQWIVTHVRDATGSDDVEPYLSAFLDIYLLSRGQGMVYLKSGFADLAAWMGAIGERDRIEYEECVGS